jgi:archaellum biogenesis protein FlaJ (TadC family)
MLAQQKEATYTFMGSVVFILLLSLISPLFHDGRSEAILVLFVLFIVALWIIRRSMGLKFTKLDEMDKTIRLQAAMIAIHGFGATVVIYALALYLSYRNSLAVPVHQVLQLAFTGWLSLYFFWSGSILVLYRRGAFDV